MEGGREMTMIDKAAVLAILAPAPNSKGGLWAKRKKALYDAIAALPAVTPQVKALVCAECGEGDAHFQSACPLSYCPHAITPAQPDDAVKAREAALLQRAAQLAYEVWDDPAALAKAILALGEART